MRTDYFDNKEKYIFVLILLMLVCFALSGFTIYRYSKYQRVINNKETLVSKVIREERNYFGEHENYDYVVQYNFENRIYEGKINGTYNFGHFKIGEELKIVIEKTNPNNFLLSENINHLKFLLITLFMSTLTIILFLKRNEWYKFIE